MVYNIINLGFLIITVFLHMRNGLVLRYIEGYKKNKIPNNLILSHFTYEIHTLKTNPT